MHEDKVIECKLNKELQFSLGQKIVVGDRVYFEPDNGTGWIKSLVPRRSFLARVRGDSTRFSAFSQAIQTIAANIDIALIVASVMNPRFTPSLIDRYLVICQNGNVNPVICLNKADLSRERHPILNWYRLHLGLEVIEASTVTGEGMERLRDCLHGKMSVLVGKSGVGKTSIINELIPGANLRTQPVGNKTGKGKHTTAISNLYRWDDESYIIDTPGVRSLGLEHIEKGSLKYYFPEFEEFEKYCKYTNCIHEHEPECGIKQAAVDGKIDKYRYESYLRILADASQ
jgi:ribosome biogenesis GTPase